MKRTYQVLAHLVAGGVAVQAALIAWASFTTFSQVDGGEVVTEDTIFTAGYLGHAIVGTIVIPLLSLALLVVSFFAGVPEGVRRAAVLFGLVVLQFVLARVSFGLPALGLLHGLNALAILGVALQAGRTAMLGGARRHAAEQRASATASTSA